MVRRRLGNMGVGTVSILYIEVIVYSKLLLMMMMTVSWIRFNYLVMLFHSCSWYLLSK